MLRQLWGQQMGPGALGLDETGRVGSGAWLGVGSGGGLGSQTEESGSHEGRHRGTGWSLKGEFSE